MNIGDGDNEASGNCDGGGNGSGGNGVARLVFVMVGGGSLFVL